LQGRGDFKNCIEDGFALQLPEAARAALLKCIMCQWIESHFTGKPRISAGFAEHVQFNRFCEFGVKWKEHATAIFWESLFKAGAFVPMVFHYF
jgi:hypothetical protein